MSQALKIAPFVEIPVNSAGTKHNILESLSLLQKQGSDVAKVRPISLALGLPAPTIKVLKDAIELGLRKRVVPLLPLKRGSETEEEFSALPAEDLLLRWLNHHLGSASDKPVKGFGADLKDGKALRTLLNRLDPLRFGPVDESGGVDLGEVLGDCRALGVSGMFQVEDLEKENEFMNKLLCGEIFELCDGVEAEGSPCLRERRNYVRRINHRLKEEGVALESNADALENKADGLLGKVKDGVIIGY